jgi:hypothetical protein
MSQKRWNVNALALRWHPNALLRTHALSRFFANSEPFRSQVDRLSIRFL